MSGKEKLDESSLAVYFLATHGLPLRKMDGSGTVVGMEIQSF